MFRRIWKWLKGRSPVRPNEADKAVLAAGFRSLAEEAEKEGSYDLAFDLMILAHSFGGEAATKLGKEAPEK